MILRESLTLSLLGGVAGLMAGVVVSELFNANPFMAGFIHAHFSPGLFVQVVTTALVLEAVGGAYPACGRRGCDQ